MQKLAAELSSSSVYNFYYCIVAGTLKLKTHNFQCLMLYILKHKLVLKMISVLKWRKQINAGGGDKIICFRFWWKSSSQSRSRLFLALNLYLFPTTKNSLFTSDINYLWNGIDFKSVILLKFNHLREPSVRFARSHLPLGGFSRVATAL